jgi:hypothetical protein
VGGTAGTMGQSWRCALSSLELAAHASVMNYRMGWVLSFQLETEKECSCQPPPLHQSTIYDKFPEDLLVCKGSLSGAK